MKNERGSALLTVILIVFVTATIGAAISSFIMMNYKLRNLDNRIGRAEYEAEKVMDTIYATMQDVLPEFINDEFASAKTIAAAGYDEYTWDNDKVKDDTMVLFRDNCTADEFINELENALNGKITNVQFVSSAPDLDTGDYPRVALTIEDGTSGFEISIKEYYLIENAPLIHFSAVYVIGLPDSYDVLDARGYNIVNMIGITDYEMQNWGYL